MSITVKNQNEYLLYYTFREIGIIGLLSVDDDGKDAEDYEDKVTGMTQENQTALSGGTYGDNLYVNVYSKAQGAEPVVLEVTGTDQLDASKTVEVTVPARTQVGQAIKLDDPATGKWKTIVSVLVKGTQPANHSATEGTQFQLIILPQKSDFTTDGKGGLINFDNGFSWNPGTTSRPIPNKFVSVDHYKRQRGEKTISVSQMYTVFGRSLEYLRDRDFVLLAEGHEDGGSSIFEKRYFSFVRLNVPNSAGNDGADLSMEADGSFRDMYVVE